MVLHSNPLYDVQLSAAAVAPAPAEPSLASTIGGCDVLIEGGQHSPHQSLGAAVARPLGGGPEDEEDAFSEFAVSPLRSTTPTVPAALAAALQAPMVFAALVCAV